MPSDELHITTGNSQAHEKAKGWAPALIGEGFRGVIVDGIRFEQEPGEPLTSLEPAKARNG